VSSKIPLGLRTALESGECVLFVGAGIGSHLCDTNGHPIPDARGLAKDLDDHFKLGSGSVELAKVSRLVEIRKSRADLIAYLSKRLATVQPDQTLRWIANQRWGAIFTTNYDDGIERCYELSSSLRQAPVPISVTTSFRTVDHRIEVPVYHLHGKLSGDAGGPIVITAEDYTKFAEKRKMLFELLKQHFATSSFLYVGYSNQDPNWNLLYEELRREFAPGSLPRSFRVDPYTTDIDCEILASEGLETIRIPLAEFVDAAGEEIDSARADVDRISKIRTTVPPKLVEAYDRNPTAVIRLMASWTFVNSEAFDAPSNLQAFLRGDRPTWSTISKGDYFARDLENQIFDQLLDYATGGGGKPIAALVLGSAGYGTSTLLMALAVKYVSEGAGPVFYHRSEAPLLEGDMEFACSLFPGQAR